MTCKAHPIVTPQSMLLRNTDKRLKEGLIPSDPPDMCTAGALQDFRAPDLFSEYC